MSGFFTVHRATFEHPLFKDDMSRLGAWVWLIGNACWKPTKFDISGKIVTLERGQLCVSVRQLAEQWGMSKSAVDRFLTRLETGTMIERDAGHGKLIITVCNYSKYQDGGDTLRDTTGTPAGTAAGQQRDLKEQGNKETTETKNKDGGRPPVDYAFPGDVIKLTKADFDKWRLAFSAIDVRAQLTSRDAWLSGQDTAAQKRWFNSTASWLAKKHEEALKQNRVDDDPMANFIT